MLCDAAARGVVVKGLIWRSHLDRLRLQRARRTAHLGEEINAAGGECLLDMRVRPGGSHHQKFVVLRHPDRPELDVAFVGGIDLCHSRRDDADHGGDPQTQPMAEVYGDGRPGTTCSSQIRGPAVGDVEAIFRERWEDPAPADPQPVRHLVDDALRHDDRHCPARCRAQLPDPAPCGTRHVQVLRTYPHRRPRLPVRPARRAQRRARLPQGARAGRSSLIYLEDQYLWSPTSSACFAEALRANPDLHLIAVVPHYPDQDGRFCQPPNLRRPRSRRCRRPARGRRRPGRGLRHREPRRHAGVRARQGVRRRRRLGLGRLRQPQPPVLDPRLRAVLRGGRRARATSGSRSVLDRCRRRGAALRPRPAAGARRASTSTAPTATTPTSSIRTAGSPPSSEHARRLQQWVDGGRRGERPPGRVRPYREQRLSRTTQLWSAPLYRVVYDPDGRPVRLRRRAEF